MERIAIIGLGQIGGSLGLAIKRAGLTDVRVAGTARSRDTIQRAKKLGVIDDDERLPEDAVRGARLVIIASPILAMQPVLRDIAPALDPGTIVTDVGSTKGRVMRWASEILPEHAHFVGGHPMAGKETPGLEAADADMFRGKPWVIVPSVDADEAAVRTVVGLAQLAGAEPIFMDADEHDSYVAAISHLPLALSSALFSVASGSTAWPELARLASSGFRDTTRLASGSPEMSHDIMMSNRDNVLHWIDRFQEELSRVRATIATGESKSLIEEFTRSQMERDRYMAAGPPRRDDGSPPIENVSLGDLLLGSKVSGFLKKQQEMVRDMEAREKRR